MVASLKKSARFTKRHLAALSVGVEIGVALRRMYHPRAIMVKPEAVIRILNKHKIGFVLMGAYALNGYRYQSRSTDDVDVLVRSRDLKRCIRVFQEVFPELLMNDYQVVTRFSDAATGKPVIDVMKPVDDLYRSVFRYSVTIGKSHRIPDLEMAITTKFAAMVSPHRQPKKKHSDAADFMDIVELNMSLIDVVKLKRLAEKVYKGGSAEIVQLLDDVKNNRTIQI